MGQHFHALARAGMADFREQFLGCALTHLLRGTRTAGPGSTNATEISSKPVTDRSPGTEKPRLRARSIRPTASTPLPARIAVGRGD